MLYTTNFPGNILCRAWQPKWVRNTNRRQGTDWTQQTCFVFLCVLPVKYLWEGSYEGWENKVLDDWILFLNRRKPQVPTRQICFTSPGTGRGSWRGSAVWSMGRWGAQGCGPAQPLPCQVPQHVLYVVRCKTAGHMSSLSPTHQDAQITCSSGWRQDLQTFFLIPIFFKSAWKTFVLQQERCNWDLDSFSPPKVRCFWSPGQIFLLVTLIRRSKLHFILESQRILHRENAIRLGFSELLLPCIMAVWRPKFPLEFIWNSRRFYLA